MTTEDRPRYMGSIKGAVFHDMESVARTEAIEQCNTDTIDPDDRAYFDSIAEAKESGYRPCQHCIIEAGAT